MKILKSLNRDQKEAIGLLQVGTFLEYFDLMLYVHMAVLLNELFFPMSDSHSSALMTAFAFCTTYILRPFGALLFGYIGDNIGRKTTVIITTTMMAITCMIMANLPTYAQIGVTSAWIVTICRIVQGLSSMGEIIGAQIYVSEIVKPPAAYPTVSFISSASAVGSMAALGIATLTTRWGFNWRIAFWIGAGIAVVGSIARTRLRETPEFVDMKLKLQAALESCKSKNHIKIKKLKKESLALFKEKISQSTLVHYFFIQCGWPITFYLVFMSFNPSLKEIYHYSSADIILHNFILTLFQVAQAFGWSFLSFHFHPLKILKIKALVSFLLMTLVPIFLSYHLNIIYIFMLQALMLIFNIGEGPAQYIFIKHIPVHKRFTASSFIYALGRAITYILTSFGIVYLTDWFSFWGTLFITLPVCSIFYLSVSYFEKLENLRGPYNNKIKDVRWSLFARQFFALK